MLPIFRNKTSVRTASGSVNLGNGISCSSLISAVVVILTSGFSSPMVLAQESGQVSVKVGEADLYPSVRLGYVSNSNVFRSSQAELEASGIRVAPSASLVATRRGLELKAGYEGAFASFSEDELNYNDHHIFGSADAVLGVRKRAAGSVNLQSKHEDLGTGFTEGNAVSGNEQVQILDFGANGSFTYGAPTARFNASAGLVVKSVAYQNRRDLTNGRDYFAVTPFGQLSYRLSSDTRALLELRLATLDFDNNSLDRFEVKVLSGFSFRGTGKSGGDVKVGVTQANYSDSIVQDRSVFTADIGVYFLPTALSRIDVGFVRQFNNEDLIDLTPNGTQTIDDTASLRWVNQWSGFVKSTASLEYLNQNRDCPSAASQRTKAGFEISVLPRKWVEVGAGFSSTSLSVDDCGIPSVPDSDYDLQEITFFTKITL